MRSHKSRLVVELLRGPNGESPVEDDEQDEDSDEERPRCCWFV